MSHTLSKKERAERERFYQHGGHLGHRRLEWPPTFPGLETPDFLRNVRGDFPPQAVLDAEAADWRKRNRRRAQEAK